mmetsp:Transcript_122170/g.228160  ORF Transcript_122170/g.228160 Transcript_122170/m.228160 type:complete len:290 (+) Transcript_122170:2094-2963(+)
MHTIVTRVGLRSEAILLPLGKQRASEGIRRRLRRISWPQYLVAEVAPGEIQRVPVYDEVVDGGSFGNKFVTHGHEESIEDVKCALVGIYLATIKATTKLDELVLFFCLHPHVTKLVSTYTNLFTSILCVHDETSLQCIFPFETKLTFKFVFRHVQLIRSEKRGLRSNRVVMLVNEHVLVYHLPIDPRLNDNLKAPLLQAMPHEVLDLVIASVWLEKDKGSVVYGLHEAPHTCQLLADERATLCIGVFKRVKQRTTIFVFITVGYLWVNGPLLYLLLCNACRYQPLSKGI